ncbi:glycerophosphodiester phosphodiesterase [Metabacillus fastidiosus]|uniref:glycerophosphodiester phosphodiesterase n=1 Tax=Metabacillus fastidiosus TaxID=1458 RepID=UPI003D2A9210
MYYSIIIILFILLTIASLTRKSKKEDREVLIIAHRGASGYAPENTIAAFDEAVRLGADFIELDVQLSKDGEIVVIHDLTVDRTTNGKGEVRNFTFSELQKLDAGSWFHPKFTGEKIQRLTSILDRYKGRVGFFIELKNPSLYPGIEEKLAEILKQHSLHEGGGVVIQAFEKASIRRCKAILPEIQTGVLIKFSVKGISNEQLLKLSEFTDFINPNKQLVNKRLVKRVHHYGMKIAPYTAKDRASIQFLLQAGVDGIVTDYPDYIVKN